MKLPFYKRLLSFLYPVCIEQRSSPLHPVLDLYLYRNQWQLGTEDAWYSDGKRYRPLRSAFRKIRHELARVHHVLVLGTGLASAVHILNDMGFHPAYTLVDIDNDILLLAAELMPAHDLTRVELVCLDAQIFMQQNQEQYPLIVCDVFMGRNVPGFVSSAAFLEQCKAGLQPGGHLILNYLEKSKALFEGICHLMDQVFPGYLLIEFGINKIFVVSV
ncbi:MAG: methyltransferase domain-containing protein [Chitinophagaceae bacterium]